MFRGYIPNTIPLWDSQTIVMSLCLCVASFFIYWIKLHIYWVKLTAWSNFSTHFWSHNKYFLFIFSLQTKLENMKTPLKFLLGYEGLSSFTNRIYSACIGMFLIRELLLSKEGCIGNECTFTNLWRNKKIYIKILLKPQKFGLPFQAGVTVLGAPLNVWSPNIYQLSQLVLNMKQIQP